MDQQGLASKGILLEDDKTVSDYGINKGSTVDLISPLSVIPIFVRTSEGKKVPLEVGIGDTIKNIKQLIEGKEGFISSLFIIIYIYVCMYMKTTL
jgi:hypothetical protein